jgi:two-component system C4-dicarboxylate transport sensor histidine kinase DctB
MVVAWLYDREIEQSLFRAHTSEKALQDERDNLEILVEERTNELKQTQFEKIEQLNRFAELGQLSSGLFHDIFNILNAISLREENASGLSFAEAFNTTKQIENFTQAIRKQLNHREAQETFSLVESIEHVIQLLAYKANKEHVRIIVHKDDARTIHYYDAPFKFHQVVLNLLLNAIESFEGLPKKDARDRVIAITIQERDGEIYFEVRDNGCGITPEVLPKIFDHFFTTKESSKGIGIGLGTIKKIVEDDFNGTITAQSKLHEGSTFLRGNDAMELGIPQGNDERGDRAGHKKSKLCAAQDRGHNDDQRVNQDDRLERNSPPVCCITIA